MIQDRNETIVFEDHRTSDFYEIALISGIGRRENQQDRAYCFASDTCVYCVVCDGMGGLSGGELASSAAVEVASVAFKSFHATPPEDYRSANWMEDVLRAADGAVFQLKDDSGRQLGAGSTMLSVWIRGNNLYWASAGDSRLYLFHGTEAVQVTTDLNYFYILNQRLAESKITRKTYDEEASTGEHLVSFLGLGDIRIIDRNTQPLGLLPGDIALLCTDGLYRTVGLDMMRDILQSCPTLEEAAKTFRQAIGVFDTAYQDNYTCVIIKIKE